jgi:DNA-binding beta-propeller fold protein YncE
LPRPTAGATKQADVGTGPALPPTPVCRELACWWTTINIARLQGHAPDKNVLKLFSAVADPQRNRVYVAAILTRDIGILDAATERWIGTVDSGIDGYAYRYLYLDPTANYLYVVDEMQHQLRRIDLNTNTIAGPVSLPEHVGAVAVDAGRTWLYMTSQEAPGFRAFDGKTLKSVFALDDIGPGAGVIALDPQADVVYVLNMTPKVGGEIVRIDPKGGKVTGKIAYDLPAGQRGRWLTYDATRRRFIVATERTVLVLDAQGKKTAAFPLSRELDVSSFAYDPARERLAVLSVERPDDGRVGGPGGRPPGGEGGVLKKSGPPRRRGRGGGGGGWVL